MLVVGARVRGREGERRREQRSESASRREVRPDGISATTIRLAGSTEQAQWRASRGVSARCENKAGPSCRAARARKADCVEGAHARAVSSSCSWRLGEEIVRSREVIGARCGRLLAQGLRGDGPGPPAPPGRSLCSCRRSVRGRTVGRLAGQRHQAPQLLVSLLRVDAPEGTHRESRPTAAKSTV